MMSFDRLRRKPRANDWLLYYIILFYFVGGFYRNKILSGEVRELVKILQLDITLYTDSECWLYCYFYI